MEFILANKKSLPSLQEIKDTYKQRRQDWNNAPHPKAKNGETRLQLYMNSYNDKSVKIELLDMVELFWMQRPEPVTLTAFGISFTEKKVKYDYLVYKNGLPDQLFMRKNIDKKFHIRFDPDDTSLIYLYEKDATGLRFVAAAETKITVARGKQEQDDEETLYITQVNNTNKVIRIGRVDEMEAILADHKMSAADYGLKTPALKGTTKAKTTKSPKKVKADIGTYEKELSNAVIGEDGEINYASRL